MLLFNKIIWGKDIFCPEITSVGKLKASNTLQELMLKGLLPSSIKWLSFMKCISIFGIKPLRSLYDFRCKLKNTTLYYREFTSAYYPAEV